MRSRTLLAVAVLAVSPALSACSGDDGPDPEGAAAALADSMTAGKLGAVPVNEGSQPPQKLWRAATDGMGESTVRVETTTLEEGESEDGADSATVGLRLTWTMPGGDESWVQDGSTTMTRDPEGEWLVGFDERALGLEPGEVLDLDQIAARRAPIAGAGGAKIVRARPVIRFGVDKAQVEPSGQAAAARALARVLDVDAGSLVERVKAAGEQSFVEALVLREAEAGQALLAVDGIEGAGVLAGSLPLAPTREFARPLLGTVGPVTAEMVEESEGGYRAGDQAGLSGLQQRYDERLRGTPGFVVTARTDDPDQDDRRLFRVKPKPGEPLRTTLDLGLQTLAERILADVGPASALVAVQPSTGDLRAVASGPGGGGLSTATVGQYAPGSTFKAVSSLALLRAGLGPDSPVSCPRRTVVDGKAFENYDDYPAAGIGRITLRQAVASSCNTVFINERDRAEDLAGAAAALGLGRDYDIGFPAYFGQVPPAESQTSAAAAMIGQGQVLASPMAMAAVAASVAEGRTVVPRLLPEFAADAEADKPLTGAEAEVLRTLLRAVVTEGSGSGLGDVPGPPVLAKTGTAEFGEADPPRTHAWMIAAQGDLAVAAFVEVGDSGSRTAGPLLERFLRGAR